MSKASEKRAVLEYIKGRLQAMLSDAGEGGETCIRIQWVSGNPTYTGRTDRFLVLVSKVERGSVRTYDITYTVGKLCGIRVTSADQLSVGGCGFSKSLEIGDRLARALGLELCLTGHVTQTVGIPSPEQGSRARMRAIESGEQTAEVCHE